ncbi:uncharacterized protein LOC129792839 [Lutzomyia longipalpis]|uniref:uncharacterized protein LOC129792839 n=1 Tax=Lutzomyia longipalpis TaxID=7200 RepID=UPI002483FC31|nr:uncharacterized protein LOC129792839 [Lutzomyia longipalpis]
MNRVKSLWLFVLIFISSWKIHGVEALRCYACTYVAGQQTDTVCIDKPEEVSGQNIVTCDKRYCTIMRQELQDPAGRVLTFSRSCEDEPLFLNDVIEDATYKTFFRSCTTDLCNDGSGISGGSGWRPDGNPGGNLVVPGLTGQSTINSLSKLIFLSTFMFLITIYIGRSYI